MVYTLSTNWLMSHNIQVVASCTKLQYSIQKVVASYNKLLTPVLFGNVAGVPMFQQHPQYVSNACHLDLELIRIYSTVD